MECSPPPPACSLLHVSITHWDRKERLKPAPERLCLWGWADSREEEEEEEEGRRGKRRRREMGG